MSRVVAKLDIERVISQLLPPGTYCIYYLTRHHFPGSDPYSNLIMQYNTIYIYIYI